MGIYLLHNDAYIKIEFILSISILISVFISFASSQRYDIKFEFVNTYNIQKKIVERFFQLKSSGA